jgi:hypothetical protein
VCVCVCLCVCACACPCGCPVSVCVCVEVYLGGGLGDSRDLGDGGLLLNSFDGLFCLGACASVLGCMRITEEDGIQNGVRAENGNFARLRFEEMGQTRGGRQE